MRRPALAVLALLAATLGVLTACSNEPAEDQTASAAALTATTSTPTTYSYAPEDVYLIALKGRGLSSDLTDAQMVQIGNAVCTFIPMMTRDEVIESIATNSTRGNQEAAEIIVDSARQQLCASAEYFVPAPTPTEPAGPVTSFASGTFEVGVDAAPGKYKTPGSTSCYWERLQENDGSVGDIIDNFFGEGPQTVTIREGEYFVSQACGVWELQQP